MYVISAIAKIGTDKLCHDIMRYLEDRADRLAADPAYKQELAELDQRIEDEARAQLQALDALNCRYAQGYLIGKPQTFEEMRRNHGLA